MRTNLSIVLGTQLLSMLFLMISCTPKPCANMENETTFQGNVLVFYHRPVSGSIYQITLIPICQKQSAFSIGRMKSEDFGIGVDLNAAIRSDFVTYLEAYSMAYRLYGRENLDRHYQKVYLKTMWVEITDIENDTESITKSKRNISDEFNLPWGKVKINYFFSQYAKVKHFR